MGGDKDEIDVEVGLLIRAARVRAGLVQADLAILVGMSRPSIANIETGRQPVLMRDIAAFAKAMECSIWALMPQSWRLDGGR